MYIRWAQFVKQDKMWTNRGGVATGNKETGHEEHMANTDQYRAVCSNKRQTYKTWNHNNTGMAARAEPMTNDHVDQKIV